MDTALERGLQGAVDVLGARLRAAAPEPFRVAPWAHLRATLALEHTIATRVGSGVTVGSMGDAYCLMCGDTIAVPADSCTQSSVSCDRCREVVGPLSVPTTDTLD